MAEDSTKTIMANLNNFLSRIQTDYAFYLQFQNSPEEALTPYELSSEERSALIEVGLQLWNRLKQFMPCPNLPDRGSEADVSSAQSSGSNWSISPLSTATTHYVLPDGSADLGLGPEALLARPEIQQTISKIRRSSAQSDRLASVLALMEHIG